MEKENKIIIFAVLILVISFLVSYNGNLVTGRFSKGISGENIKDITGKVVTEQAIQGPLKIMSEGSLIRTLPPNKAAWEVPKEDLEEAPYTNVLDALDMDPSTTFGGHQGYTPAWWRIDLSFIDTRTGMLSPIKGIKLVGGTNFCGVRIAPKDESDNLVGNSILVDNGGCVSEKVISLPDPVTSLTIVWPGKYYRDQMHPNDPTFIKDIYITGCTDSDSTNQINSKGNYDIKGTATYINYLDYGIAKSSSDSCVSGGKLREYYCTYNMLGQEDVICPSGTTCSNGACISTTPPEMVDGEVCGPNKCNACKLKTDCIKQNEIGGLSFTTLERKCNNNEKINCEAKSDYCEWYAFSTTSAGEDAGDGLTADTVKDITGKQVAGTTGICRPKTKCVWNYDENSANLGYCCGDGMKWSEKMGICIGSSDLCYSFWPDNKVEGKGAKYTERQVCWNIGSVAYGFWVPVGTY
jgi:hypothetical protein